MKILVSQPRPVSDHNPYSDMEARYGVTFDFRTLIHVEGLEGREFRQQRINPLDYTAVLFNSRLGIDHFFRICEEIRVQVPETMHYYCISEAIGNYLQKYIQYRKRKVFFGPNNKFEDLLPAMYRRPNEKYMMVVSDNYNDETIRMFAEHNIEVTPAVMFRTVSSEWPKDVPCDYGMLVFFTATGVQSFCQNFPDWKQGNTVVACFGQGTQEAAVAAGWDVAVKAPTAQFPSITAAIDHYLKEHE